MITYNGVIDLLRDFANKHLQINYFSVGSLDKVDLDKMNEYPILHIDLTNISIEEKTVSYDLDVYILSGVSNKDAEQEKNIMNIYSDSLQIMQDLFSELFEGSKIIDTSKIQMRGSDEMQCTPIDEQFENRVFGLSSSISIQVVNEQTSCLIPYPYWQDRPLTESWDGSTFIFPDLPNWKEGYYWWSANEKTVENISYDSSADTINAISSIVNNNNLASDDLSALPLTEGAVLYDYENQAINIAKITSYLEQRLSWNNKQIHIGIKIKKVKDFDGDSTRVLNFTKGSTRIADIHILSKTDSKPGELRLQDAVGTYHYGGDCRDDSDNFIAEDSITIGISITGSQMAHDNDDKVDVYLNGQKVIDSIDNVSTDLDTIVIGNNEAGVKTGFMVDEVYIKYDSSSNLLTEFESVLEWMAYRK